MQHLLAQTLPPTVTIELWTAVIGAIGLGLVPAITSLLTFWLTTQAQRQREDLLFLRAARLQDRKDLQDLYTKAIECMLSKILTLEASPGSISSYIAEMHLTSTPEITSQFEDFMRGKRKFATDDREQIATIRTEEFKRILIAIQDHLKLA